MNVVVVESPAKAKTINKYLGRDYKVIASFGHVRDLPSKEGAVQPDADFTMIWNVDSRGKKQLDEIARAVKEADRLILATDPDREGEAISWHILEELQKRKSLKGVDIQRVVFNEITKSAILDAMQNPRSLNVELIDAYLARRALDYLVGFTLSPLLWRKLPGSRSAGRVQSVALRLICEREAEIEAFRPQEYWTVSAGFQSTSHESFTGRLTHLHGKKLDKFDLPNQFTAETAKETVTGGVPFRVSAIERKTQSRYPAPPFTTSTLQQEASRKLGLSASRTMRIAQKLYEGVEVNGETAGLITYMRTDGVQIAKEAIDAARGLIRDQWGDAYLPSAPRQYKSVAKNAQEAHEAIRPTDLRRTPQKMRSSLAEDEHRLYELIWKRTLASQMQSARFDMVAIDLSASNTQAVLRVNGSIQLFDGFLTLYQEDQDDSTEDGEGSARIPALKEGETVALVSVTPEQHFTQAPPRYSEASLVKKLEELGIGRPSTYASILQVLQDRNYVRLDKRRFIPEDTGRIVTAFLTNFFERYFAYDFTAQLEQRLDEITAQQIDWKQVLQDFWTDFSRIPRGQSPLPSVEQAIAFLDKALGGRAEVNRVVDETLGAHFFPDRTDGSSPRACPACANGRIGIKFGRTGPFIGCSNYPECTYTRSLRLPTEAEQSGDGRSGNGPRPLGTDPDTDLAISVRIGPYGPYVQLGDKDDGKAVKRVSLPKHLPPDTVTLAEAKALLSLPRTIGVHPETDKPIIAGIGRFGPYIKHDSKFVSLRGGDDVLSIGLNRAVTLLAEAANRTGKGAVGASLGAHPETGNPISMMKGRYGPYLRYNETNYKIPKDVESERLTLEEAVSLIASQAAKPSSAAPKTKARAKTAAKASAWKSAKGRGKDTLRKTAGKAKIQDSEPA